MSSILRFIKKKFQPLKRQITCTNVVAASSSRSASSSFEDETPKKIDRKHHVLNEKSKTIRKRQKSQAHNSRVVGYLKSLEAMRTVSSKQKEEAVKIDTCQARARLGDEHEQVGNNSCSDELERIQDELFNDDDLLSPKPVPLSSCEAMSTSPKCLHTTSSPISSFSSSSLSIESRPQHSNENTSTTNETRFMNRSIEKIRRSISSPKLNINLNSTTLGGEVKNTTSKSSRMSLKDILEFESSSIKLTDSVRQSSTGVETLKPMSFNTELDEPTVTTSSTCKEHNEFDEELDEHRQHFLRGVSEQGSESNMRLSTNIKRMFKSVIEHQTNALNSLERFYECQLNRIEIERANVLAHTADEHKPRINALYDRQLKMLEQRVENNLKNLLDNKKQTNQAEYLNKMLQSMLIKQIQAQQQEKQQQQIGRQSRSRTLSGLKANLIAANQMHHLLPPKANTQIVNKRCASTCDEADITESRDDEIMSNSCVGFKRNHSLPFKQTRLKIGENVKEKSPNVPKQASSRVIYNANCYPSPSMYQNEHHQRQLKACTFVKNSAQKKQQQQQHIVIENLRRATVAATVAITAYSAVAAAATTTAATTMRTLATGEASDADDEDSYDSHRFDRHNPLRAGGRAPRLSDGNWQYRAATKRANFEQPTARLFHSHSHNHIVSSHETEV